jgi:hypothetical protein
MDRETLIYDERKLVIGVKNDMIKAFDQAILALSATGLSLSVAVLQNGNLPPSPVLVVAWAGFVVAAASTTVSLLTSHAALGKDVEYLHALLAGQVPNVRSTWLYRVTTVANVLAAGSFLIALVAILVIGLQLF